MDRRVTVRTIQTAVRDRHEPPGIVKSLLYRGVMELVGAGPVPPEHALEALLMAVDEVEDRIAARHCSWEELFLR